MGTCPTVDLKVVAGGRTPGLNIAITDGFATAEAKDTATWIEGGPNTRPLLNEPQQIGGANRERRSKNPEWAGQLSIPSDDGPNAGFPRRQRLERDEDERERDGAESRQ